MKKQILGVLIGAMGFLLLLSFSLGNTAKDEYPEESDAIHKTSCMGCNNKEARSEEEKKAE